MFIIQWLLSVIPWILLVIITATIVITLLCKYPAWDSKNKDSNGHPNKPRHKKWFYAWLIGLSALGGFWALFLPLALNQKFDGPNADGNQLRLHLLYITGGVLALITLGETHRKNTVDREKAKEQQRQFNETIAKERERIEVDKAKNEQDHIRQVHAERRSRYTAAIEQLSSDKASIRLGGVYTLVGLVDEWLADEKTIPSLEQRRKEGQAIINNLCAYIRSPFDLASKAKELSQDETPENYKGGDQQFIKDQVRFREEKEIRLTILSNFKERLGTIIEHKEAPPENHKGAWSDFNYSFSTAVFFYPIDFSDSYFSHPVNFDGSIFIEKAIFEHTKFNEDNNNTNLKVSNYNETVFSWDMTDMSRHFGSFNGTIFIEEACFDGAAFENIVCFIDSTFKKKVTFLHTEFTAAIFSKATFRGPVNFQAIFVDSAYSPLTEPIMFKESKFSIRNDPNDYIFNDVNQKINTVEIEEESGTVFTIPKYASLFSPETPTKKEKADISLVSSLVKRGRGFIAHILEARNTL